MREVHGTNVIYEAEAKSLSFPPLDTSIEKTGCWNLNDSRPDFEIPASSRWLRVADAWQVRVVGLVGRVARTGARDGPQVSTHPLS